MLTDIIYDALKPESLFAWACILGLVYWAISSIASIGRDPNALSISQKQMKHLDKARAELSAMEEETCKMHGIYPWEYNSWH
ncbi:hypothetical protein LCGC14_1748270 [marine sediment metagenome]|uniref:Uncharacterized protein n=1 Tax=marine sediment metagenome TaxID=412755 RepID=A0A0F9K431_9ZZZZ